MKDSPSLGCADIKNAMHKPVIPCTMLIDGFRVTMHTACFHVLGGPVTERTQGCDLSHDHLTDALIMLEETQHDATA